MFNNNKSNKKSEEIPINKNRSVTVITQIPLNNQNNLSNNSNKNDTNKESNTEDIKAKKNIVENNSDNNKLNNSTQQNNSWTDVKINSFLIPELKELWDIENFNESKYSIRKYTKDNLINGKQFFKIRFIKNKIDSNDKKEKKSFINNILGFKSNNDLDKSHLDKEKNFRIYNSDFLMILEKAILNFNHKNYKDCYDTLYNSKIIKNPKEFGEFLLVVSGFDKYLIGEYLAKNKYPNEKSQVLNSFIDSINMEHQENTLLDCVRFLLSRINLPKDANLILLIMETFTNYFFKVNKNSKKFIEIFGNENNIYLLVSTLLALNTMFTRKDIKNMNTIKKDEFINMNNKIKESYLNVLYDELKNKPITMADDYNEYIYQKLTPLVTEKKDSKKNLLKNDENPQKPNLDFFDERRDNLSKIETIKINFDNFTKEDEELLCNINKFYKITGSKNPSLYEIIVYENCSKLIWDKKLDLMKTKKYNSLNIRDINEVYNGLDITEHSSHIKKYIKANPNEEKLCNSFISISYNDNKEILDLKSDSVETALLWFKALKSLVNKERKEKELENNEETKQRENLIKEIWENFILKKWDKYGNLLLLKIHERTNYYNYLSNDLKQSTKNELLEDKKVINIKYINNFLENIKTTFSKKDIEINEFYFLCNLGFPNEFRKNLWNIIIGNPCYITDKLYHTILNKISDSDLNLNFKNLEEKFNKKKTTSFNRNTTINQIITDIIIVKNFFVDEILEKEKEKENEKYQYKFMLSVYKIANALFFFRKDIPYNKNFIDIIYLFLLVWESEENTFKYIINFLSNDNYIKLLLGNEELRNEINKNNISFFNQLIKNKLPNIEEHFRKLEIIPELYFIPWMDDLYIKTLNIKILLQIFDIYLINGEYVLFQIGLSILKILEDELKNMTISQILNLLKRLPDKYKKEKFFEVFNNFNSIKSEYVENKRKNELEQQKKILALS